MFFVPWMATALLISSEKSACVIQPGVWSSTGPHIAVLGLTKSNMDAVAELVSGTATAPRGASSMHFSNCQPALQHGIQISIEWCYPRWGALIHGCTHSSAWHWIKFYLDRRVKGVKLEHVQRRLQVIWAVYALTDSSSLIWIFIVTPPSRFCGTGSYTIGQQRIRLPHAILSPRRTIFSP
jgi:hypothetical protein